METGTKIKMEMELEKGDQTNIKCDRISGIKKQRMREEYVCTHMDE
jgi:hypothetical protein